MLMLKIIWMTAVVLIALALLLWIALLIAHAVAKRRDEMVAVWSDLWMERLLDVLDGTHPPETLPVPQSQGEMEAVIGLLRELGERFRGSYGSRMSLVLNQIQAADYGMKLLRSGRAENRIRGCALLAWCGPSEELDARLRKTLDDRDPRAVLEASAALVKRGSFDDIVTILKSLCKSRAAKSLIARDVFRQWAEKETRDWSPLLSQQWTEDGWILLMEASGAAARGEWTPLIARLVRHPSPSVVGSALVALQALGDPEGAEAAQFACGHDRFQVRRQAVRTLVACGDPAVIPPLLGRLLMDESFEVRRAAMDGLLKLGWRERMAVMEPEDDWQRELFKEAGLREMQAIPS